MKHWLPTREYEVVKAVGDFPSNLTVRLSAHGIDMEPPSWWPTVSKVVTSEEGVGDAELCPAPQQGGTCGTCWACWSTDVKAVAYRKH
jgi:hypothetical protein